STHAMRLFVFARLTEQTHVRAEREQAKTLLLFGRNARLFRFLRVLGDAAREELAQDRERALRCFLGRRLGRARRRLRDPRFGRATRTHRAIDLAEIIERLVAKTKRLRRGVA